MLTKEQREFRKERIGGSDAASACGLNPYKSPRELWFEKMPPYDEEPEENEGNFACRFGLHNESLLIKEYERVTGFHVEVPKKTFIHKDYPFLIAHVDGLVQETDRILEVKTCSSYEIAKKFKKEGSDYIPTPYLMQCVHYCLVLDKDAVDIVALISTPFKANQFKIYHFKRHADLEQKYLKRAIAFFEHLQKKTIPPALTLEDAMAYFDLQKDTAEPKGWSNPSALELAAHIKTLKTEIKTKQKEEDQLAFQLIQSMGNHDTLIDETGEHVATIQKITKQYLDQKLLKSSNVDITPYMRDTTYNQLRFN